MKKRLLQGIVVLAVCASGMAFADEWHRFRGENGSAVSTEKKLPVEWSETENIVWRTKMPGPGTSSPVLLGDKIYLTSYSGYGTEDGEGEMDDLMYHLICVNRKNGKMIFDKKIAPNLPERNYSGYMLRHGYTSSTPATDGKHLYVFLGKTGVFCFDLDGNKKWQSSVGDNTHGWGSATSPVLYKNLVIINASVESGALVALDKNTGNEVWRAKGIKSSWNTPVLVDAPDGSKELVVGASLKLQGFDPDDGKQLWQAKVYDWYICPSLVAHDGVVYGLQHRTCFAVRAGGEGDVTESHVLWQKDIGSVVTSLVYHQGHVYWCHNGRARCLDAKTGKEVYSKNVKPRAGTVYSSPIVADGKLYYISQNNGTFVVAASPEFKQLAHNTFADDDSRTNASPIADEGCLIMRTDRYLVCIANEGS